MYIIDKHFLKKSDEILNYQYRSFPFLPVLPKDTHSTQLKILTKKLSIFRTNFWIQ